MDQVLWQALGITRTADRDAIRRAYAARLKAIDIDGDPAAFMRLRSAFEAALAATCDTDVQRPERRRNRDDGVSVTGDEQDRATLPLPSSPAPGESPAAPWEELPGTAFAAFSATFRTALDAGDSRDAGRALRIAMAQGILPLGLEEDFAARFLAGTQDDPTLSPEALTEFIAMFGVAADECGYPRLAALFDGMRARIAALRWYADLQAVARRGETGLTGLLRRQFSRPIRVALAVRDATLERLGKRDLPQARIAIATAHQHAPWLDARLDLERLDFGLTKYERRFRASLLRPALILAFLGAAGITANFGGGFEILCLVFVALACLSVGGWILPLIGLTLLAAVAMVTLHL